MSFVQAASPAASRSTYQSFSGTLAEKIHGSSSQIVLAILLGLVIIALTTRYRSGVSSNAKVKTNDGNQKVTMEPYWFPLLGHILPMAISPEGYMATLKDKASDGILSLNLGGSVHNILFWPSVAQEAFQQRANNLSSVPLGWHVLENVFGAAAENKARYEDAFKALNKHAVYPLLSGPSFQEILDRTVQNLQQNVPNLTSFNDSLVDQSEWERVSGVHVVSDEGKEPVVEVSLYPLLRDFMGHNSTPAIMGTAFLEACPNALQNLWGLDDGFRWLASGLPSWLPIPGLRRAAFARSGLVRDLTSFHDAMQKHTAGEDPGYQWSDLDDVSTIFKQRHRIWFEHGFNAVEAGHGDATIFWAMNANANPLCFWLLLRILADPTDVVSRIREEITPYVKVSEPEPLVKGSALREPTRVQISVEGLHTSCPLLKSSYLESLRLDSAPWSIKKVMQDFILPHPASSKSTIETTSRKRQGFMLQEGSYVTIPHTTHHMDSKHYESPHLFNPERFITENGTVDPGTLKPYGGGEGICKGRNFAERECLALVAGVLQLWDFEPATKNGKWVIPKQTNGNSVFKPAQDLRVRIKRR